MSHVQKLALLQNSERWFDKEGIQLQTQSRLFPVGRERGANGRVVAAERLEQGDGNGRARAERRIHLYKHVLWEATYKQWGRSVNS